MMNYAFPSVIPSAQTATQAIHSPFSLNRLFLGLLAGFTDPLRNYLVSQKAFFSVGTKRKRASLGFVGVIEEGSEEAAGTSLCGTDDSKPPSIWGCQQATCHLFTQLDLATADTQIQGDTSMR